MLLPVSQTDWMLDAPDILRSIDDLFLSTADANTTFYNLSSSDSYARAVSSILCHPKGYS